MTRHAHSLPPPFLRALILVIALVCLTGCGGGATKTDAPATSATFWPAFPQEPRIQFLTQFQSSSDIVPKASGMNELIYGKETQQTLDINKPYGVAMTDGRIYVCDTRNACVLVLDLRKHEFRAMGATGGNRLRTPVAVRVAPDGNLYVADSTLNQVQVFDAQERSIGTIGHPDFKPVALGIHGNELFVADFAASKVEVFDRTSGQSLRTIGAPGQEDGQLAGPLGLDVDDAGNVYVSDVMGFRVQKFTRDGKFIFKVGAQGREPGTFARPKHIAVDKDGILYVVDAAFQNVQMFNDKGQLLLSFGSAGDFPGYMDLPAGITVHDGDLDLFKQYIHPGFDAKRLVIVTNQFGPSKVAVYAYGSQKPGANIGAGAVQPPSGLNEARSGEAMRDLTGRAVTQPSR